MIWLTEVELKRRRLETFGATMEDDDVISCLEQTPMNVQDCGGAMEGRFV